MAKVAKPKRTTQPNPRSRASKRASSPTVADKSLSSLPRASDATPILGVKPHQSSSNGVKKSKKKAKPLKRGQLRRQEKGLARAEIVMDQLEKKKEGSQARVKAVRGRRAGWEEINEGAVEEVRKTPKLVVGNEAAAGEAEAEGEWEDVGADGREGDTEMKVVDGVQLPANAALAKMTIPVRPASNAGSDLEDIT